MLRFVLVAFVAVASALDFQSGLNSKFSATYVESIQPYGTKIVARDASEFCAFCVRVLAVSGDPETNARGYVYEGQLLQVKRNDLGGGIFESTCKSTSINGQSYCIIDDLTNILGEVTVQSYGANRAYSQTSQWIKPTL
eukprot:TRINITY_DN3223_c0_g1_i1.p1 TRINITY_DN3223_c0_g1~~TRINITY_DN3223_c0_g1_i1.p1  ORF type:complete len:139 (-),score=24.76 TRINITY_DN3223_c0_g1_i1:215-631(-)